MIIFNFPNKVVNSDFFKSGWLSEKGVFESMLLLNGVVPLEASHMSRLEGGYQRVFHTELKKSWIEKCLRSSIVPAVGVHKVKIVCLDKSVHMKIERIEKWGPQFLQLRERDFSKDFPNLKTCDYKGHLKLFDLALSDGYTGALEIHGGEVLETGFANIIFFDGERWVTPKSIKILPGILRHEMLERGLLAERKILVDDLKNFESSALINSVRGIVPVAAIDNRTQYQNGNIYRLLKERVYSEFPFFLNAFGTG